jgi:putative hydrolase of the HAD superfamily
MVIVERGLKAMLRRLPGRKIVFSNAPFHYARAVLAIAGIDRCFDALYSIERFRFLPKPAALGFWHLLRAEKLVPESCIMVEDSLNNLRTAKRLGMTTVWVGPGARRPLCADVKIGSVLDLPHRLRQLRFTAKTSWGAQDGQTG